MRHLYGFLCLIFLPGGSLVGFTTPICSSLLGALSRLGIVVFHRVGGRWAGPLPDPGSGPYCFFSSRRRCWLSTRPG